MEKREGTSTIRRAVHVARFHCSRHKGLYAGALVMAVTLCLASWALLNKHAPIARTPISNSAGPPWVYGSADARYTVVEYADLECPFCRAYFSDLKRWIDAHPDVNWQWHHLPLPMHDPVATEEARLAECAGLTGGQDAFWKAITWIYENTRGNGQGVPRNMRYPGLTASVRQCLESDRADANVRAQTEQAGHDSIAATPTLRLLDRKSGKILLVHGPLEDDALLSAIDLLTAPTTSASTENPPMSADAIGDMPR